MICGCLFLFYVVFLDVVARHFEFELQNFKLGGKDIEKL